MKTAGFAALCSREWAQEARGDVVGLALTDDSLRELAEDVVTDPLPAPMVLRIPEHDLGATASGLSLSHLVNPITRSDVEVAGGAPDDTATVAYMGPDGMLTRTVPAHVAG